VIRVGNVENSLTRHRYSRRQHDPSFPNNLVDHLDRADHWVGGEKDVSEDKLEMIIQDLKNWADDIEEDSERLGDWDYGFISGIDFCVDLIVEGLGIGGRKEIELGV
jgi:hypothetical protein